MEKRGGMSRREALATGALAAASWPAFGLAAEAKPKLKGRIKQSASLWCYRGVPFDRLCQFAKDIGMVGIDLCGPGQFEKLKAYGLVCTMTTSHGIGQGFNRKENHEGCIRAVRNAIEATAKAGFRNVICFSGNCKGMADDVGLKNCAEGLKQIVGLAEEKKVAICMEYLNSKQHKDYMADDSQWCFDLVKAVGSPAFKILYDIYHVAMMEAKIETGPDGKKVAKHNIIEQIQKNIDAIGHFHTGGFPGRKDIDESQLLDHPAIMRAIAETSFDGYVAHEFVPKARDADGKLAALEKAVRLCDV